MDLDENLDKTKDVFRTWESHINEKIGENLKNAIKHREQNNINEIEIDDMGAIDRIEDGVVSLEILNGTMLEVQKDKFNYDIEEGDIINLKLTYKNGNLADVEVLDKNEEEKRIRLKLMQEKIRRIRNIT